MSGFEDNSPSSNPKRRSLVAWGSTLLFLSCSSTGYASSGPRLFVVVVLSGWRPSSSLPALSLALATLGACLLIHIFLFFYFIYMKHITESFLFLSHSSCNRNRTCVDVINRLLTDAAAIDNKETSPASWMSSVYIRY